MPTLFSHIIQKRFSQVNEDVATDALAYILESSEAARHGMMKLLWGITANLPQLRFRTQQVEGTIRPDMWGYADAEPRAFVESKFWAGLTDSQPVSYLKRLAGHAQPSVLLIISPAARQLTLWNELSRRLIAADVSTSTRDPIAGIAYTVDTHLGPTLALTSWTSLLSVLEHETVDDPGARSDLVQLRGLCQAADDDAFPPICLEETSDQRTPAFILQLGSIVQAAVDVAVSERVLSTKGLLPQASWHRIGRYVMITGKQGANAGAWIGVHLGLWKVHGTTPLWLYFSGTPWGRGPEVRSLVEPWAAKRGILTATLGDEFAIALQVKTGEDKATVVGSLVDDIKAIAAALEPLAPRPKTRRDRG